MKGTTSQGVGSLDIPRVVEGFRRFAAGFQGEPDRVPVIAQSNDHTTFLLGLNCRDFYTNPATFVKGQAVIAEYYDLDLIPNSYDCYNIEAEALGQRLIWTDHAMPDVDTDQPLLGEKGMLDRLIPPIPGESGRMPYALGICRAFRELTGLPFLPIFCAPFSLAVALRGYRNLVRDFRQDAAFAHRLFEFLVDRVLIPWAQVIQKEVPEAPYLLGADAWSAPPIIDLRIQEEFIVPYAQRLQEKAAGAFVMQGWGFSSFAEPARFLETLLRMKVPYIYGMDPEPERLGPEPFKAWSVIHALPLCLGIHSDLLRDGPVEAIVDRVRRYVKVGAPGGRFFIFLNDIPADTPPIHVHAAIAAIRQFGAYPLEVVDEKEVRMPPVEPIEDFLRRKGITDKGYFYE